MEFARKNFEIVIITITPLIALEWIKRRKNQRKVSQCHINNLAHAMTNGDWENKNSSTMAFDTDGNLIDGQHRLYAVIESNTRITCAVAFGCPPSAIYTIDTGAKPRSFKDLLEINGNAENTQAVAAAIRLLYYYRKRLNPMSEKYRITPTMRELADIYEKNPTILDSVLPSLKAKGLLSPSQCVYFHFVFSEISKKEAADFFRKLSFGTGEDDVSKGCPIALLRKRLLENGRRQHSRITPATKTAITIKAWNHYREGKSVKNLRWNRRGRGKQGYPWPK